jgi:hypothetical protein
MKISGEAVFWLPFLYGYFIKWLTYKQFAGKTSFLAGKVQKRAGKQSILAGKV